MSKALKRDFMAEARRAPPASGRVGLHRLGREFNRVGGVASIRLEQAPQPDACVDDDVAISRACTLAQLGGPGQADARRWLVATEALSVGGTVEAVPLSDPESDDVEAQFGVEHVFIGMDDYGEVEARSACIDGRTRRKRKALAAFGDG